jgi:tetratricopeptide (TPR) repeat protein
VKITPHLELADAPETLGNGLMLFATEEQALMRSLRRARALEEAGEYEAPLNELSKWCPNATQRPRTDGLGPLASGELLLRVGVLVGYLGSARHTRGAQARAKRLIAESIGYFEQAGMKRKVEEGHVELARCRHREGDFDGAGRLLWRALEALGDDGDGLRAKLVALLLASVVEDDMGRRVKAYDLLKDSAPLFSSSGSPLLLGRFYNNLGIIREKLGEESGREEYLEAALIDHAGACGLFEEGGAHRLLAQSENNCALLLIRLKRFDDAARRLERSLRLFGQLGDAGHEADVKETWAQLHLAQRRYAEAERYAKEAVSDLEGGERQAVLVDALTTLGTAQAESGPLRFSDAWKTFARAVAVAEKAGALGKAGLAALTAVEKLGGGLTFKDAGNIYVRACSFLEGVQSARTQKRQIEAGLKIIKDRLARDYAGRGPTEQAGEVAAAGALFAFAAPGPSGDRTPMLIKGDSAGARRLRARREHEQSERRGRFVAVNCAALEKNRSYEPESFARRARRASGGTLFLDEVQELSGERRRQLWCLLTQGVIGTTGPQPQRVDVRIIAGTSCDLSAEVMRDGFPVGLYERLCGYGPQNALSAEDFQELRALAGCLIKNEVEHSDPGGKKMPGVAGLSRVPAAHAVEAITLLLTSASDAAASQGGRAPGPGGATAVAAARFEALEAAGDGGYGEFKECARRIEHELLRKALIAAEGHITVAARLLNINRRRLDYMLNNEYPDLNVLRAPCSRRGRPTRLKAGTKRRPAGSADEVPDVPKKRPQTPGHRR